MTRRWAFFERVPAPDVNDPCRDQMIRWRLVQTPWFGLYVHRINSPDDTRPPHTHPWPFVTLILRGGYHEDVEHREPNGRRREWQTGRPHRAGSVHLVRATTAHRITRLRRSPTWTLVIAGRRRPEPSWGYWEHDGFIPWQDHPAAARFEAALQTRKSTAKQARP